MLEGNSPALPSVHYCSGGRRKISDIELYFDLRSFAFICGQHGFARSCAAQKGVSSMPQFSLSTDSWDLHRRAERDRKRHNEKVKEVIKKNLGDIISQQDIITAENGKIVKIPIRGLELPRIRYDNDERERVGQGAGGSKPGDIIARGPQ